MELPRLHLFEFNDSPWAPKVLRDTVVESLALATARGHLLAGAVAPFMDFVARAGVTEVLDLCAGAGQPAAIFARELMRAGRTPPRFTLTDLFPRPEPWQALREELPGIIDYDPRPVDARHIPPELGRNRARVIVNALHHFRPEQARALLMGAAQEAPGVFVAEGQVRNPLRFAAFVRDGIPAMVETAIRSRDVRRAAMTLLTPAAIATSLWDGTVSAMRMYTEAELREFVAPLGETWTWTFGEFAFRGFGRGSYFYGVQR